jgi:Uma2 family endonuclease
MVERLTVAKVEKMVAAGLVPERSELLDGVVVVTPPYGPTHALLATRLFGLFYDAYRGTRFWVRGQVPLICGVRDEPQPDVSVVRGRPADYAQRHPHGSKAILVVEISDSTLRSDRRKAELYAAADVSHYWIMNVAARIIETYSDPQDGRYGAHETMDRYVALPGLNRRMTVKRLFG